MRFRVILLGAILVFASNLHAQANPNYSLPEVSLVQGGLSTASAPDAQPLFALAIDPAIAALESPRVAPPNSSAADAPAQQQPTVYGVFQNYNWQIYGGYSFMRLYVASKPSLVEDMSGLDLGIAYFLPKASWFGVEGQFVGEFGSLYGYESHFALGAGGARFRWSIPRGLVIWAHGMGGFSHLTPQTAFGGQTSWAYEVGGGLDIGAHHRRLAYRVEADMVGTRYFGTYQDSPRISAGIVFKY